MTKKTAIITTVALVTVAYIIILVALPALSGYMAAYGTSGTGALYTTPIMGYIVPGVIGLLVVVFIAKQKKGVDKDDG